MALKFPEYYNFYLSQARHQQAGSGPVPFFKGSRYSLPYYQNGGNLFHRILPFIKKAISFAKSDTGRKIIGSAKNIGSEVISNIRQNQNIKNSVKEALKSEGKQLLSQGLEKLTQKLNNKREFVEGDDLSGAGILSYLHRKKPKLNLLPNNRVKTDRKVQQIMRALKRRSQLPLYKPKTKRRKRRKVQSASASSKGKTIGKSKRRRKTVKKKRGSKKKSIFPGLTL